MLNRRTILTPAVVLVALFLAASCGSDDGSPSNGQTNNQSNNQSNGQTNNQSNNQANNGVDPINPDEIELREEFVKDPPEIEEFTIQRFEEPLDGGNTRFAVRVADEDLERVGRAFAFLRDTGEGEPVRHVLRNDGAGADVEADDEFFSTAIDVEVSALERLNSTLEQGRDEDAPVFEVRELTGSSPITLIDVEAFESGAIVSIPPRIPLPMLIFEDASLMITDLGVVEDSQRTYNPCTGQGTEMGAWTFGQLMTDITNQPSTGIDPSNLTRDFFEKWLSQQTVTSSGGSVTLDQVAAKSDMQTEILDGWQQLSDIRAGTQNAPLDLAVAPFRLLAIVNRVDLKENGAFGPASAGEARFVFGALKMEVGDVEVISCERLEFTVIFEYEVPIDSCSGVRNWGEQWADLSNISVGSSQYNSALENITDQFAGPGVAPNNPNGSAISQIRTNEVALGSPWELREFRLPEGSASGMFEQVTVKKNPLQNQSGTNLNNNGVINSYIQANSADVAARTHTIPNGTFNGNPFVGGVAQYSSSTAWDGNPTLNSSTFMNLNGNELRHKFSLTTCSGCHADETGTTFTHVSPTDPPGTPASLSGFLTGKMHADPVNMSPMRRFDDLSRRVIDLNSLVNTQCQLGLPPFELGATPILMPH